MVVFYLLIIVLIIIGLCYSGKRLFTWIATGETHETIEKPTEEYISEGTRMGLTPLEYLKYANDEIKKSRLNAMGYEKIKDKYKLVSLDDILFAEELDDEIKEELISDLHNYSCEEAEELCNTVKQEEKKAKLKEIKRRISKKTRKKYNISTEGREPIPEDVQHQVWNRDSGKCVKCGSREKLEFDHIIPFSKGGSNTARNLQLLCEKCNREKRDKIGG